MLKTNNNKVIINDNKINKMVKNLFMSRNSNYSIKLSRFSQRII